MKFQPQDEIPALLRRSKPDIPPPPGLDQRILAALRAEPARGRGFSRRAALAVAAAVALAAAFLALPDRPDTPTAVAAPPDPPAPVSAPAPDFPLNPLEAEAAAIARDARRVGHFLVHCLPSVGEGVP